MYPLLPPNPPAQTTAASLRTRTRTRRVWRDHKALPACDTYMNVGWTLGKSQQLLRKQDHASAGEPGGSHVLSHWVTSTPFHPDPAGLASESSWNPAKLPHDDDRSRKEKEAAGGGPHTAGGRDIARHSTSPDMSCDLLPCGLSDHFKLKTLILIQKNPGSGGMANINKCLMISLCFLFPVITEIIGLRWGGGCRWDKINDLNCLDFPRLVVHQFPRWGEIMTNKSNQEQRRDSQRRSTSPPC